MTSRWWWNEIWMFSVQCQLPLVSSPAPQTVTLVPSSPARHMWQLDRVWPGNVTKIDGKKEIWKHLEAATCSGSDTFVVHVSHLPTINWGWFERSCGFPLLPFVDSSSWLLTFTSSKSVHVRPKLTFPPVPSSQYLPVCAFFRAALNFALQDLAARCMIHDASSAIICQNKGHHGHPCSL